MLIRTRTRASGEMGRKYVLVTQETGRLATLIFPLKGPNDDASKGPPYPVDLEDYERALRPFGFEVVERVKVNIRDIFHLFSSSLIVSNVGHKVD